LCKKAYSLLLEWNRVYGPLTEYDQFEQAVFIAYHAEENSMARQLLDEWKRKASTTAGYYRLRALVEFHIGAFGSALDAVAKIPAEKLKDDPDLIAIRAACRQKLHLPELAPIPRAKK
jgi:hypothetical protein